MRIGLLHGWLLDGSGSNVYVRELARALVRRGCEVYVFCQEPHPDRFPRTGHIHIPAIDRGLMPVHVADTRYEGFQDVQAFSDLTEDPRLEVYLEDFAVGVRKVCEEKKIQILHANHVYPMPEVARRVKERAGVPYIVYPHGSAIEYTLKRSDVIARAAGQAIEQADALVVGNKTVTERIYGLYPDRKQAWSKKHSIVSVGVDLDLFEPVNVCTRDEVVGKLESAGLPKGGRTRAMTRSLLERKFPIEQPLVKAVDLARGEYDHKAPDEDLVEKLADIDWANDKILIYTGKLIVGKGLHDLMAAMPEILMRQPRARLIVVGEGPYREGLELLLGALSNGNKELVERIVRMGGALDRQPSIAFDNIMAYADRVGFERWLQWGQKTRPIDRVVFTGYLKHEYLRHVLPCADIAVFPSEIAEAYPLVLLEAISAGVLPVASYFEGLGEGLDEIASHLPEDIGPYMRIERESWGRIASLVDSLGHVLNREPDWRNACRSLAAAEYSWDTIAKKMEDVYKNVVGVV